jgi:hypothetical protein
MIKGVKIKELLPHLKDSEHAAVSLGQVKKYRQQLAGILAEVDALLLTLGGTGGKRELALERLKQILIEDVRMDEGYYYGKLLCEG